MATPFDYIVLVDWNINAFFSLFICWTDACLLCVRISFWLRLWFQAWNRVLILKTNMFNLIFNSNVAQFHKNFESFFLNERNIILYYCTFINISDAKRHSAGDWCDNYLVLLWQCHGFHVGWYLYVALRFFASALRSFVWCPTTRCIVKLHQLGSRIWVVGFYF